VNEHKSLLQIADKAPVVRAEYYAVAVTPDGKRAICAGYNTLQHHVAPPLAVRLWQPMRPPLYSEV
jgi:hypothetical protein